MFGSAASDRESTAVQEFHISRMANTLTCLAAAAYGWHLHGIIVGLAVLVVLWVVRRWTANAITWRYIERSALGDEEPDAAKLLRLTMASRWAWVTLAFVVLTVGNVEICSGSGCAKLWG